MNKEIAQILITDFIVTQWHTGYKSAINDSLEFLDSFINDIKKTYSIDENDPRIKVLRAYGMVMTKVSDSDVLKSKED